MKSIKWVGAALLVSAAAIAAVLATAQAGDRGWLRAYPAKKLTGAQKTGLLGVCQCAAPALACAALKRWQCALTHPAEGTDLWVCDGSGTESLTEAAYVERFFAGTAGPYETRTGGVVTVPVIYPGIQVSGACLALQTTWIGTVWPGETSDSLQAYLAARNPVTTGQIDVEALALTWGSDAEFLDAGGGKVGGPTPAGTVQ